LKRSRVVLDSVTDVRADHVLTAKGVRGSPPRSFTQQQLISYPQEIGFDYLVLCPGSTYSTPFKASSVIISNRYLAAPSGPSDAKSRTWVSRLTVCSEGRL
jgi:hypothetical protein